MSAHAHQSEMSEKNAPSGMAPEEPVTHSATLSEVSSSSVTPGKKHATRQQICAAASGHAHTISHRLQHTGQRQLSARVAQQTKDEQSNTNRICCM